MDAYREILMETRVFWIIFLIVGVVVNLALVGMVIFNHARDPEDGEIRRRARRLAKKRVRASVVPRDEEAIFRELYADAKKQRRARNRKEWVELIIVDVIAAVLGLILLIRPLWKYTALTMDIREDSYVSYYGTFEYKSQRGGSNNVYLTERGNKWVETAKGIQHYTVGGSEAPDGSYRGYVVYGRHSGAVVSFRAPASGVEKE